MAGFRGIGFSAVLGLVALPTSAQQIDLYGVTEATLEWSPASGPVTGYYVIVARNGGTPALQGVAKETRATISSPVGEMLTVQVAAFDAAGVAGPVSAPSSEIHFNPAPGGGDPPPPAEPDPPPTTPDPGSPGTPDAPPGGGSETPPETPPATQTRFDYTGDGFSDLLLRDPRSGELVLWEMQKSQVVRRTSLAHLPYPWRLGQSGDFDGDGTADLLWRNPRTGQLIVWLIREGSVASGAGLELGASLTRDWTISARGDFDGNGTDDLVLAHPERGVVDLLLLDGTRIASRVSRNAPGDRWRVIAAPDADGDGIAEIVWENVDSHALSLEWMSSPGRSTPLVSQPGAWRILGSGDLDGDGRDDLLVQERNTRVVRAWLLDGNAVTVTESSWARVIGDRAWSYRGLGDFDGDGGADAFFYHSRDGAVGLWFMTRGGVEAALLSEFSGDDKPVGDLGD